MKSEVEVAADLDVKLQALVDRLPLMASLYRSAADAFAPAGPYLRELERAHAANAAAGGRWGPVPKAAYEYAAQQHARLNRIADSLHAARKVLVG